MVRRKTDNDEEIIDFTEAKESRYRPTGKSKQARRSRPGEPVYKKRKQWWLDIGFGEDAAEWAAAWRFGEPKKTRGVESEKEGKAIENAIRVAYRRREVIASIQRRTGETRAEVIKKLDDKLRFKDLAKKLADHIKGVEFDTSIYDKSIEPNIFLDVSPD